MTQAQALVVDDEPDICELLKLTLGRMDLRTEAAMDVAGAKSLLDSQQRSTVPTEDDRMLMIIPFHAAFFYETKIYILHLSSLLNIQRANVCNISHKARP